jgi:hypothetical protein
MKSIFHTPYAVNYKHVLTALKNNSSYIIWNNQVTYIPFYIKHIDAENRSVVGKMYAPVYTDIWKCATKKFSLNYSYLPENKDQFVIVRNHQKKETWSIYETSSSAQSVVRIPDSIIKLDDILLLTYVPPPDRAILM